MPPIIKGQMGQGLGAVNPSTFGTGGGTQNPYSMLGTNGMATNTWQTGQLGAIGQPGGPGYDGGAGYYLSGLPSALAGGSGMAPPGASSNWMGAPIPGTATPPGVRPGMTPTLGGPQTGGRPNFGIRPGQFQLSPQQRAAGMGGLPAGQHNNMSGGNVLGSGGDTGQTASPAGIGGMAPPAAASSSGNPNDPTNTAAYQQFTSNLAGTGANGLGSGPMNNSWGGQSNVNPSSLGANNGINPATMNGLTGGGTVKQGYNPNLQMLPGLSAPGAPTPNTGNSYNPSMPGYQAPQTAQTPNGSGTSIGLPSMRRNF